MTVVAGGSIFYTLRKHWKKSIFFSFAGCYGIHYSARKYREYLIRREYFTEAKKYGEVFCHPLEKPRRLYIILNPQAGNSKCKKLFMKNAAPIFHLAGIDVTYIQTSYEGHSKTLVNYFDPNIDGVVAAGGDGTMQEIVTGLLRQTNDTVRKVPVGFIPLGYHSNTMYRKLFDRNTINVRSICKSAMAIVKANTKPVNVLEIKTDEKSIYALSSLRMGIQQHAKERIDIGRFWLMGPLKKYFAFVWSSLKDWPGYLPIKVEIDNGQFSVTKVNHTETNVDGDDSHMTGLNVYLCDKNQNQYILVEKLPSDMSRLQFISYGWNWLKNGFMPTDDSGMLDHVKCKKVDIEPIENSEGVWYDIDGEVFDARKIEISICPNQIQMFCDDET